MVIESRIHILSEDVVNKIAAGEVVERPASVIKELAENAVDAGATSITVHVEDGGKRLIRVTDDGIGMTAQEAVIAMQRHATSKLVTADDLDRILSLGFRGEALPSIASVSRMQITTRARGELEGVRVVVENGEVVELEPTGAPEGTEVLVQDLFYNTPARLKFLKTARTELGRASEALVRIALARSDLRVRLTSASGDLVDSPGYDDLRETIAALHGRQVGEALLPVELARDGVRVSGYVTRPTYTRPTRSGQYFFVNGRAVRHRTLSHALSEAFRSSLRGGRHPYAVLNVELSPALVDVNVHPAKTEVRFVRDWEIHRAVHAAVREALGQPAAAMNAAPMVRQASVSPEQMAAGSWTLPPAASGSAAPAGEAAAGPPPIQEPPGLAPPPEAIGADPPSLGQPPMPGLEVPLAQIRPIAQLWRSFILAEGPEGLLIIDQHLAHERVLFDRLRSARDQEGAPSQRLAVPLTLEMSHQQALLVDEALPELAQLGFEIEPFGRDSFMLRGAPAVLKAGTELGTLRNILDQLLGGEPEHGVAVQDERVLATTACKAAIKKGERLAADEMKRLLDDLARTAQPHTCPHGCPIAVELSYHELLRRFKRT